MANVLNLFKFIASKRPKYTIPLRIKLINNLPLTKEDLTVDGNLNLFGTQIKSLPDNLTVNGYLDLSRTPISRKYTEEEILKMIEDSGGSVGGKIIT